MPAAIHLSAVAIEGYAGDAAQLALTPRAGIL
jgi:hypothetical protein